MLGTMRFSSRAFRVVAVTSLLLGASAAVGLGQTTAEADAPIPVQRAYVQGDSVMVGAEAQVNAELKAVGWTGTVTGFIGLHTYAAIPLFKQVRDTMGSVAVIELGANDCCDTSYFASEINQTMQVLSAPAGPPPDQGLHVIWLTLPDFKPGAAAMNATLEAAATRWPNLQVAHWGAVVAADPGLTWPDGIHLKPAGSARLAAFIRDALDAWYAPYGGPDRTAAVPLGGAPGLNLFGDPTAGGVIAGAPVPSGAGYWLVDTRGGVYTFGDAPFYGSLGSTRVSAPISGMASTPSGRGYWLVGEDGGVFTFGDAPFYGSLGNLALAAPIVGMAATPDGRGYWLVGADGGVFSFGDAPFYGSAAGRLKSPAVGLAPTPDGRGYWVAGADGTVVGFGDAPSLGSAAGYHLAAPIESITPSPGGVGYWLLGSDGGVFSFGDARFDGSAVAAQARGGAQVGVHYADLLARPGGGYWLVGSQPQSGTPAVGAQPLAAVAAPKPAPALPSGDRSRAANRTPAPASGPSAGLLAWVLLLLVGGGALVVLLMAPRARANRARRRRHQALLAARDGR